MFGGKKTFMDFLKPSDREILNNTAVEREYREHDVILREGDKNKSILIIEQGEVSIVANSGGFELELARLGEGDIIGDMSFIDNAPVSADVNAASDVKVRIISSDRIAQFILRDPFFYGRFYKALAKTLSHRLRAEANRTKQKLTNWEVMDLND